jgi:hypothetical protein
MNYLMYMSGGIIKKFPLVKPSIIIGRESDCDIILIDPAVSKQHCRVEVKSDHINIIDLHSHNGTFIDHLRIKEAQIAVNSSFGICATEFYLKQGGTMEFAISRELSGLLNDLTKNKRKKTSATTATKESEVKYNLVLPLLVEKAIINDDFATFCQEIRTLLQPILPSGNLIFVLRGRAIVLIDQLGLTIAEIITHANDIATQETTIAFHRGKPIYLLKFGFDDPDHYLLYCCQEEHILKQGSLIAFLHKIGEIINFNLHLIPGISFNPSPVPVIFMHQDVTIIGTSPVMKRLIEVTKKIAPKNTFVIVMGESGTGKEMIAKLIHLLSGRR